MPVRLTGPTSWRRLLSTGAVAVLTATCLIVAGPAAQAMADQPKAEPGRRIIHHTVQPGDTPSGLAVRYHAWTAEVIEHNQLGSAAGLRVGDRIEIPVVISAAKARKPQRDATADKSKNKPKTGKRKAGKRSYRHGQLVPKAVNRATVRRVIAKTARRRGVDPQLALAVAWQESGWQMDQISSARAIGAMQVLSTTVDWMEFYVDRGLNPYRVKDNAAAGVELLRVLGKNTDNRRQQVAAYYQGLGAVREHGLYRETRPYVRNVLAIKRRLERGQAPG